MSHADTALIELVEHVQVCVCAELIDTASRVEDHPTCPCLACAVPGTTTGQQTECCDSCGRLDGGSLKVNVNRIYPSTNFPSQDLAANACQSAAMAVDLTVRLLRCIPVYNNNRNNGDGATPLQLQQAADVSNLDAMSLYRAATCCIPERPGRRKTMRTVLSGLTSVSDSDCAGWDLNLILDLGTCGC